MHVGALERIDGGVSTLRHELGKRIPADRRAVDLRRIAGKETVDEVGGARVDLRLSERPKLDPTDSSGQRLRDPRGRKNVRRAGKQEPPGRRILVNRLLDRVYKVGNQLHLIN